MTPKPPKVPDLLEALRAAFPPYGRPAGPGWYTRGELEEALGRGRESLRNYLAKRMQEGTVETAMGTVLKNGVQHRTRFFRITGKP